MPPYGEDLAYIHDQGHGDFARAVAPQVIEILRKRGIESDKVVDLGCGSGVFAAVLCDAGYDVLGVDISASMIELARRRAPDAKFRVASFLDVELPSCRAVTALGEVLGYALDPKNNRRALGKLFRKIHTALEPGGLLLFDIPDTTRHKSTSQSHRVGEDWAVMVDFERDLSRSRLTRKIVSFRKLGDTYRRADETHVLHLFRPRELADQLRAAGFTANIVRSYGGYRLWPGGVAFVARKRR